MEGLEVDLGRGEREGEEGADSRSGGCASSGRGGVASVPVRAHEGGEREGLEVDLGRGEREVEEGRTSVAVAAPTAAAAA